MGSIHQHGLYVDAYWKTSSSANLEGGKRHVRTRRFPRLLHKTRPIPRCFDGGNRKLAAELQQSYKH